MNSHVRNWGAGAAILLIHSVLVLGFIHPEKAHFPVNPSIYQVTLHFSANEPEPELVQSKQPNARQIRALQAVKPQSDVQRSGGQMRGQTGEQITGQLNGQSSSKSSMMNNAADLQAAQVTAQRQSQISAVLAGLSAVSSQLGSVITDNYSCEQQVDDRLYCVPEPRENERLLIVQFFNLVLQAHRLGVSSNPARVDFGDTRGVSIMLQK